MDCAGNTTFTPYRDAGEHIAAGNLLLCRPGKEGQPSLTLETPGFAVYTPSLCSVGSPVSLSDELIESCIVKGILRVATEIA